MIPSVLKWIFMTTKIMTLKSDLHLQTVASFLCIPYEEVYRLYTNRDPLIVYWRRYVKEYINFGFPAGLGSKYS